MKSSIEHFEKACEILKSHNIQPVRHFSPYSETGEHVSGSGLQVFWDRDGNEYKFLFNTDGECTWSNLDRSSSSI